MLDHSYTCPEKTVWEITPLRDHFDIKCGCGWWFWAKKESWTAPFHYASGRDIL